MILSFHPCIDAHVQVVLGDRALNPIDLELIRKAEAIILPQGCPEDLYTACSRSGALIFPNFEVRFKYPGKIGQNTLFERFGYPHPTTLCWSTVEQFRNAYPRNVDFPHKLPFLIKDNLSHEGEGVYLVEDKISLSKALSRLARQEKTGPSGFLSQSYVSCGGNVLRAVIIGKRVITYWKLPKNPGHVITTISRGAMIDHHWRPDLKEKGEVLTQALSKTTGINLAAIDFVFPFSEKDSQPLFLEINYYFARRGLGGIENYYNLLFQAILDWLGEAGLDPRSISLY